MAASPQGFLRRRMTSNVLRFGLRGAALGAGVPLGYQALPGQFRSSQLDELMSGLMQTAMTTLKAPPAPPPPPPALPSAELTALLNSNQALSRTMDHLLSAQSRASARATLGWLIPVGALGALGFAWYKWGWDGFGWVSLKELQVHLDAVKETLGDKIAQLKEEVMLRFTQVEEAIRASCTRIDSVNESVNELRGDVAAGNATMSSMEQRLSGIESNTERTAQSVELLVHLVSGSPNLLADADEDAVRRLRAFTGELPAPPPRAALPPPPTLQGSSSSIVQMLMMPPPVTSQ